MAAKNIVITNGSITETTYNSDKIEQQISAGVTSHTGASSISGNLTVGGDASVTGNITGGSIVETMTGYGFVASAVPENVESNVIYAGAVKNGNKLTLVIFGSIKRTATASFDNAFRFYIPASVLSKIYPFTLGQSTNIVDIRDTFFFNETGKKNASCALQKGEGAIYFSIWELNNLNINETYLYRYEATFLLSDNLVA